jgi:NADH-quinone oxidoreductase subunit C
MAVQGAQSALKPGFVSAAGHEVEVGADASGTPCVDVPWTRWLDAARHVRGALGMDFFDWLSAVDQADADPPGVDVVLHVASTEAFAGRAGEPRRLLLRTRVPESDLRLASVTGIWPGAAWHERETHEMFGVTFDGFDDGSGLPLRPLLLPEGFEGTPLRKSFVLTARASKPWPGAKEPGESDTRAPGRRRVAPPGVPDPATWGPREPAPPPAPADESKPEPAPDEARGDVGGEDGGETGEGTAT